MASQQHALVMMEPNHSSFAHPFPVPVGSPILLQPVQQWSPVWWEHPNPQFPSPHLHHRRPTFPTQDYANHRMRKRK